MSMYGHAHPPPPGPTPEEARTALALTQASQIVVRVRDLALSFVAMAGLQLVILLAVYGAVPDSWPPTLTAVGAGLVVLPFVSLQNLVRSIPRGFKSKAGLAALLASWFAIWLHSTDWALELQLLGVAAGFILALVTVLFLGTRRR